jgi:hypothetical protein
MIASIPGARGVLRIQGQMAKRAPRRALAEVVDLAEVRVSRRLSLYRARLQRVLKANRKALERLFSSGTLFSRQGTRAGRDLLLAHEHLLRVVALLDRLDHDGDVPAPRKEEAVAKVFTELDTLLQRTGELGQHTASLLGELSKE